MARVKGTLTKVGKGKFGFFLMLQEREGFYFNTKYEPKAGVGDVVGIEFTPKGDTRGNVTKVKLLEDKGGPKGAQHNEQRDGGSGGGGGGGRSDSIVWQHSQEMAVRYVDVLLSNGAVKLPKDVTARQTVISALADEATYRFFVDANDPKASKTFKDEAGVASDSGKEESKGDDFDGDDKSDDGDDWDSGSDDEDWD